MKKQLRTALVFLALVAFVLPAGAGPWARARWGAPDGVATVTLKPHGAICMKWSGGEVHRMIVAQRKNNDLENLVIGRRYKFWERDGLAVHWEPVGRTSITPASVDPQTCQPVGNEAVSRRPASAALAKALAELPPGSEDLYEIVIGYLCKWRGDDK